MFETPLFSSLTFSPSPFCPLALRSGVLERGCVLLDEMLFSLISFSLPQARASSLFSGIVLINKGVSSDRLSVAPLVVLSFV